MTAVGRKKGSDCMKIGLLGMGVVGGGVMEQLAERADIQVKRVLARRPRPELGALQAQSFDEILADPEIDTIVEVIGGMDPAYDNVLRSLQAGKNVVSANKWKMCIRDSLLPILSTKDWQFPTISIGGRIWISFVQMSRWYRADWQTAASGRNR